MCWWEIPTSIITACTTWLTCNPHLWKSDCADTKPLHRITRAKLPTRTNYVHSRYGRVLSGRQPVPRTEGYVTTYSNTQRFKLSLERSLYCSFAGHEAPSAPRTYPEHVAVHGWHESKEKSKRYGRIRVTQGWKGNGESRKGTDSACEITIVWDGSN